MKYQHITEDEIKIIREAKKVMKKIAKRFSRLEAKEKKALLDENADWKPIAEQIYRFCDEIDSILDFDYVESKISINIDVLHIFPPFKNRWKSYAYNLFPKCRMSARKASGIRRKHAIHNDLCTARCCLMQKQMIPDIRI